MSGAALEPVIVISDSDDNGNGSSINTTKKQTKRKSTTKVQAKASTAKSQKSLRRTAKTKTPPNQQSITNYFKHQKLDSPRLDNASARAHHCTPKDALDDSTPSKPLPAKQHSNTLPRGKKVCPDYKVVEGTRFAVDAFQFGDISGVDYYFLTHFHADHYVGLRKSFAHPLYVSRITARLVAEFVGVDAKYMREHDINVPFYVDGVEIIALDANHCPGAVMYQFRLPATGRCILHTGDFRASAHMETYPSFWNHAIDTIYLDTTYLSTKGDFIAQHDSLDVARRTVHRFLGHAAAADARPVIVVGTYLIGKEKVWMSIADAFDLPVWLEASRRRALDCIYPPGHPIFMLCVADASAAVVHVLPMQRLTYAAMSEYRDQLTAGTAGGVRLLALRPSGWEKDTTHRLKPTAALSMVGIAYSEHSAYEELARFVRFLRPRRVISTVPVGTGGDLCRTAVIPGDWLNQGGELRPQRQSMQTNIMSFMKSRAVE